jgi:hypothetical protein
MKAGRATVHSIRHSDQSSETHQRDVEQAKANRNKRKALWVEVVDEKEPFRSDVSLLGGGQRFALRNKDGKRRLETISSPVWEAELLEQKNSLSWYHQPRKNSKSGYTVRKIKDRTKLGDRDRRSRNDTDLLRETIDLRPDHSRAMQYLLQAGHAEEVRKMAAAIRIQKILLFEKLYPGRAVVYVSEHDDAGQYHHDLWHTGITEAKGKFHRGEPVRERVPFKRFGVGVGVCSWFRHFKALSAGGGTAKSAGEAMGPAYAVFKRNTASAKEQNGEPARDVILVNELDEFVAGKLAELVLRLPGPDRDIPRRAHQEYKTWLTEGYAAGELGVRKGADGDLLYARERLAIQAKEMEILREQKQKLAKENSRLRQIAELATRVVIAVADSRLWKTIEKLCAKTANALRALAGVLDIASDVEKKPAGHSKRPREGEEMDIG